MTETLEAVVERLVGDAGFREWHANINEARAVARAAYLAGQQQERERIDPLVRKMIAICSPGPDGHYHLLGNIFGELVDLDSQIRHPEQLAAAIREERKKQCLLTEVQKLREERDAYIETARTATTNFANASDTVKELEAELVWMREQSAEYGRQLDAFEGGSCPECGERHDCSKPALPAPPEGEKPHRPFDIPRPPKDKETTRFPAERERKEPK